LTRRIKVTSLSIGILVLSSVVSAQQLPPPSEWNRADLETRNFDFFHPPGGVGEGLGDVLGLKVGVLAENLVPRAASRDETDHGANGDTHAPNARFAAHYGGVTSDAGQLSHVEGSSEAEPYCRGIPHTWLAGRPAAPGYQEECAAEIAETRCGSVSVVGLAAHTVVTTTASHGGCTPPASNI